MTVKVLVTALGQQIVAGAKQIENKDNGDLVGYWLENAKLIGYTRADEDDDNGLSVNFGPYCLVSDETAFSVRAEHIVAILEPRADVLEAYEGLFETAGETEVVSGEGDAATPIVENEDDATDAPVAEGSDVSDSADGTAGA